MDPIFGTGAKSETLGLPFGKPGDHVPSAAAMIYSDDHVPTWPVNKELGILPYPVNIDG